jgi:hypothetical protein
MLTPFDDEGTVDWGGLEALIDWYLEKGAEGLFAVCHSGQRDFGYSARSSSIIVVCLYLILSDDMSFQERGIYAGSSILFWMGVQRLIRKLSNSKS